MRRRERQADVEPPARLVAFALTDWLPLVDDAGYTTVRPGYVGPIEVWRRGEALTLWSQARLAWWTEHGWPGGGDPVTLLREALDVRRAMVIG